MSHWVLAVDFGTSNTAAAVRFAGRPDQTVRLGASSTVMPTGVACDADGTLLVGETARHAMGALPKDSYHPTPKRQLGRGDLMLGFHRFSDVDLVAAVLRGAADRAARMFDGVTCDELRLTYPAVWAEPRRRLLSEAAVRAGLPEPLLVPEPVAAATYYAAHHPSGAGGPVAVYDMGGGTLDVAVLRPTGETYDVLSVDGVDPLGGETFDEQLELFARDQLGARGRADLWERLEAPDGVAAQRTMLDAVRNAKHVLSEVPVADIPVAVGDDTEVIRVTRAEFVDRIRPWLTRSVTALRNALATAGLTPEDLDRLYLVGGSTYIPAVPETITQSTGITPATYDDPKTVTSLGVLAVPPSAGIRDRKEVEEPAPVIDVKSDRAEAEDVVPATVDRDGEPVGRAARIGMTPPERVRDDAAAHEEHVGMDPRAPSSRQTDPFSVGNGPLIAAVAAAALALVLVVLSMGGSYTSDAVVGLAVASPAAAASVAFTRARSRKAQRLATGGMVLFGALGAGWLGLYLFVTPVSIASGLLGVLIGGLLVNAAVKAVRATRGGEAAQ